MIPRISARFRKACIIAIVVLVCYQLFTGGFSSNPSEIESNAASILGLKSSKPDDGDAYVQFSRKLVRILKDTKPPIKPLVKTDSVPAIGFHDHQRKPLTRPNYVPMSTKDVDSMRAAHKLMVQEASNITLPFENGTRGIVSTAGGSHLPIFIISLRMLRRSGSQLPVELFLRSDQEYGPYLCQDLLPSLNARCVILDDFISPVRKSIKLEKYQYKIFSILYSSFEEVLLLDADNFPVHNVDHVFTSEPFTSSGLVTWPDFWISSASPKFYQIQGTKAPLTNVRASTESGQVLVSKRTHSPALLAATYYNYYGPSYYYPLLTQGAPGEGDKETFLAGASAVGAPFYQVESPVSVLGYHTNGELHGVAMLQSNPVDDYVGLVKPLPFSIHANFPKMDPNTLFGTDGPAINPKTGEHHRLWGTKNQTVQTFGMDIERELWEEIKHVACILGGVFVHWKAAAEHGSTKSTCQLVEDHIEKVFGGDDDESFELYE